ncbi:MAG: urease accessory protein UreF [Beijerinckiaceae bacterium]
MTDALHAALALQAWVSPAYPVGGYAYSHALEWAVERASVSGRETLTAWLKDNLLRGSGWNDAVLFAESYRRCICNPAAVAEIAELAAAMAGPAELRRESLQQGRAFLDVTRKAWPHAALEQAAGAIGEDTAYPVCFAAAAAAHGCDLAAALEAYIFALAANWISAAVRLNVVGQTAAQEIAAGLAGAIADLAARACASSLDDLGGCAFLNEIASFKHEEQYSRLFRS